MREVPIERRAKESRHRYSRGTELYCYGRWKRSLGTKYELFWLNMHYLCGLLR